MSRDLGRLTGLFKKVGFCFVLVPAFVIVSAPRAEAILRYYIHDFGGVGRIDALGSLNLPAVPAAVEQTRGITAYCPSNSPFFPPIGGAGLQIKASIPALNICTGDAASSTLQYNGYVMENSFQSVSGNLFAPATSVSGLATGLIGETPAFYIQSSYNSGGSIASSALFSGTLASVGISGSGLMASYNILDGTTVTDTIFVLLESPPRPVPGPLPIVGASLAFAWSRQLRQRVATR
jgi:hypothetical protein